MLANGGARRGSLLLFANWHIPDALLRRKRNRPCRKQRWPSGTSLLKTLGIFDAVLADADRFGIMIPTASLSNA